MSIKVKESLWLKPERINGLGWRLVDESQTETRMDREVEEAIVGPTRGRRLEDGG